MSIFGMKYMLRKISTQPNNSIGLHTCKKDEKTIIEKLGLCYYILN